MSSPIKSPEQIEKIRIAGQRTAEVLEMVAPKVVPGVTTGQINDWVHDYIVNTIGGAPSCLGYHGFPKSVCTSVNHQVCHGIPSDEKVLKDGDIVNIDVTVDVDGYHGDSSIMVALGEPSIQAKRLIRVTRECLLLGIATVKPGAYFGDIGEAIQNHAHQHRYSVVREYCGHGVGLKMHEDNIQVLHYGKAGTGLKMEPGMIFTIEPMINAGRRDIRLLSDNWTVVTKDRKLSAQWEHTILVTETGHEILTRRSNEDDLP
ncbi:MAG: type I methionyl aminopeptidase [Legionellales bacterium]|nr:type I methionyl aminopeptidase [Legionellales bacterium]